MTKDVSMVRRLAAESLEAGDGVGWFERLYSEADGDLDVVPWADLEANPRLQAYLQFNDGLPEGTRALVVGCGLGDDAEALAAAGADVTAFDISPSAIEWARKRFPDSPVTYVTQDLATPPEAWLGQFDLIFEAYTLQAVPTHVRERLVPSLPGLLAPGGVLLIVCRGGEEGEAVDGPPWKLSWSQFAPCLDAGLVLERFDDFMDEEDPPVRRFIFEFLRAGDAVAPVIPVELHAEVAVLQGLRARLKDVVGHLVSIDGYERWGNPTPEQLEAFWKETGVEDGEEVRLQETLAEAVADGRETGAVEAWAAAHVYLLEQLLRAKPSDWDSTARFVVSRERRAWLAVAGGGEIPAVNSTYVRHDPAAYADVFGLMFPAEA